MRFRKGRFKGLRKQVRQEYEDGKWFPLPEELIKSGDFLSPRAFRIFCIIHWFNPSIPSYKTLCQFSGYKKQAVSNALEELELKCLIQRNSGHKHRENNHYLIRRTTEWQLLTSSPSPSQKQEARKIANRGARRFHRRKNAMEALVMAFHALKEKKDRFDYRTCTSSIIEPVTSSIIELEPDQLNHDQLTILGDAMRQRCPNGQDLIPPGPPEGGEEGVALSGDAILKERLAVTNALLNKKITKTEWEAKISQLDALEGKSTLIVTRKSARTGGKGVQVQF